MSDATESDLEALVDLQTHRGWFLFCEAAEKDVQMAYDNAIAVAVSGTTDEKAAFQKIREAAAIKQGIQHILGFPKRRISDLRGQARRDQIEQLGIRRPAGV